MTYSFFLLLSSARVTSGIMLISYICTLYYISPLWLSALLMSHILIIYCMFCIVIPQYTPLSHSVTFCIMIIHCTHFSHYDYSLFLFFLFWLSIIHFSPVAVICYTYVLYYDSSLYLLSLPQYLFSLTQLSTILIVFNKIPQCTYLCHYIMVSYLNF